MSGVGRQNKPVGQAVSLQAEVCAQKSDIYMAGWRTEEPFGSLSVALAGPKLIFRI